MVPASYVSHPRSTFVTRAGDSKIAAFASMSTSSPR